MFDFELATFYDPAEEGKQLIEVGATRKVLIMNVLIRRILMRKVLKVLSIKNRA